MRRTPWKILLCAWVVLLCATASAQRGAIVQSRNLADLTAQAQTIVVGRVAFAHVEPHPQFKHLHTAVITVQVSETLKGTPVPTLTFRQFIWDPRDIEDAAAYHRGDEMLLLLNPQNQYGLTTPAGLNQGRFAITRDASGKGYAVNGYGNQGLFEGMLATGVGSRMSARSRALVSTPAQGPVALDDLRRAILDLAAGGQQ